MTDHLHDVRNLVSGYYTSPLAFRSNLSRQAVLLGGENSSLMKANRRGMQGHVGKYDARVIDAIGES
jgi:hypothetical protein